MRRSRIIVYIASKENKSCSSTEKKKKKARRWSVRPVNRDREKKGEFRRIMLELKLCDEEWFFRYTRMTVQLFEELVILVGPSLKKNSIKKPICPSQRLLMTLRYL